MNSVRLSPSGQAIHVDLLGHSYFAQAEALLHDIFDLMRRGQTPTHRQHIWPALEDGVTIGKLRK